MKHTQFNFELGNRDLFPAEVVVVKSAKQAFIDSAIRHGAKVVDAEAVFSTKSEAIATATVHHAAAKAALGQPVPVAPRAAKPASPASSPSAPAGAHRAY